MQRRTDNCVRPVQKIVGQFRNYTKDSNWETLVQQRIAHLCALFKAYTGEWVWKTIHDRLHRSYYMSRVDHVQKIRDRKQRKDFGKYFFEYRTIKNWIQLPAAVLDTFPCKPTILRKRVSKQL